MSTAPAQIGTTLLIGMNGITYTGTIVEDGSITPEAKVEEILDENNATVTKVISNPASKISLSALVKGTGFTAPVVGQIVAINSVNYFTNSASVSYSRGVAKFKFDGVK